MRYFIIKLLAKILGFKIEIDDKTNPMTITISTNSVYGIRNVKKVLLRVVERLWGVGK